MRVVGTAGHVDHGKSTLIAALTGIHPDRLKEEQTREMTIDLGFAWLTLPDGETIGVVDVPGHRDFIENMLAGVGGIDAVIFVVAADEGVMPQTREHLAILDILQVQGGVIALTKIDLIDDPEWLDMVEMDVRQAVQGTILADAPLARVSARTGSGLDMLKDILMKQLAQRAPRPDLGRARLPVDRVFTMQGFGTVVTGTLIDGRLRVGEEVELLPGGLRGRVRGLQTHKHKEETAQPGSRTAVNISGIDVEQVRRGDVLAHPGRYRATGRFDAFFRLLPDASTPLHHSSEVKVFAGAAEVLGRVRLLGVEELRPGEEGWLQLELRDPLVVVRGDRYILRRPSPGETLGGGVVVDISPTRRHKRFDAAVLKRLATLLQGSPADVLLQALFAQGIGALKDAVVRARLSTEQAALAVAELLENSELIAVENGALTPTSDVLVAPAGYWREISERIMAETSAYHAAHPLRRGIPREELKSRSRLTPRAFSAALRAWVNAGLLVENGNLTALAGFSVRFTPAQKMQADRLLARFAAAPFNTPSVKESQAELGEELYSALVEDGQLVQVSPEVVFRAQDYAQMRAAVEAHFAQQETLTAAAFRDRFNTSRKYALAFLEHLDAAGVTARDGDVRRLRKRRG